MKCKDIKNLLSLYIDNELDSYRKNKIEEHLEECKKCKKYYYEILKLNNDLISIKQLEYNEQLESFIMSKIKDNQDSKSLITYLIYSLTFIIIFTISLIFNLSNLKSEKKENKIVDKISVLNYDKVMLFNVQENSLNMFGEKDENK